MPWLCVYVCMLYITIYIHILVHTWGSSLHTCQLLELLVIPLDGLDPWLLGVM